MGHNEYHRTATLAGAIRTHNRQSTWTSHQTNEPPLVCAAPVFDNVIRAHRYCYIDSSLQGT